MWHLHLIYTRNYWDIFCKEVLGKLLHHEPATGVDSQQKKLGQWYASTYQRYRQYFGDPPDDIWPHPDLISWLAPVKHRWVDITNKLVLSRTVLYGIVGLVAALIVVAVAALMEHSNEFE